MADNVIPFPGAEAEPDDAPPFSQADIQAITQQLIDELGSPEAVLQALGAFGGFEPFGGRGPFDLMSPRPKPKLLRKRSKRATYVVRLDLDDAKPPIWRRLRLRSDVTLGHLHGIIQVAMGWTNSHLHQFKMGPSTKDFMMMPFLTDYDLSEGETDGIPENDVRLDQVLGEPGHRLFYEYDFGDSWHHTIKLERVEPWVDGQPDASCVTGRRAWPIASMLSVFSPPRLCRGLTSTSLPSSRKCATVQFSRPPLSAKASKLYSRITLRCVILSIVSLGSPLTDAQRYSGTLGHTVSECG